MTVKRFLELLDVDYEQWRALVINAIRLDVRVSAMRSGFQQQTDGGLRSLAAVLILCGIVSVFFGVFAWMCQDVFLSATAFLTYVMFMVGSMVLIDFHAIVISPDDYGILGYQPVSSRTYLAAKLTNVLIYTITVTTVLGAIPVFAYLLRPRSNPLIALAAALAMYLCSSSVTLAMILLYASIMRRVHPKKLRRALSYLQLAMSFLIYGGYMFVPQILDKNELLVRTLRKTPWIFLHPATWFASYLDLARGKWGLSEIAPALFSLAATWILFAKAGGKLSLGYSEQLASLSTSSEGAGAPETKRGISLLLFKRDEARAVALLVRNQFKYDQKFRLAVLGVLPLAFFYLYMGLRAGPLRDPFSKSGRLDALPLYLILLLFPLILKANLAGSDSFLASWIFYATPADRSRIVSSMKDFLMFFFVLPCLMIFGIVFEYFFRNLLHVVLHLAMLALLSHVFLQAAFILFPELPFSRPIKRGEHSGSLIVLMILGSTSAILTLTLLFKVVYPNLRIFLVSLASLAGLSVFLESAAKARLKQAVQVMQYYD